MLGDEEEGEDALKTKHAMKKPASKEETPNLNFPGEGKRPPLHYGRSVVYFSPDRYRLMKKVGDRVDFPYPYKATSAREAWRQIVAELRRLNPEV